MNTPLYSQDVQKIAGFNYPIYIYRDILKFKTLDQLLGKSEGIILLYEVLHNIGHWVTIFKLNSNTVEHFDNDDDDDVHSRLHGRHRTNQPRP